MTTERWSDESHEDAAHRALHHQHTLLAVALLRHIHRATASARNMPLAAAIGAAPARRGLSDSGRHLEKRKSKTHNPPSLTRNMNGLLHPVRCLIARQLKFAGTTLLGIEEKETNAELTVIRGRCCFCSKKLSKDHTKQKCWLNLAHHEICYATDDEEAAIAVRNTFQLRWPATISKPSAMIASCD